MGFELHLTRIQNRPFSAVAGVSTGDLDGIIACDPIDAALSNVHSEIPLLPARNFSMAMHMMSPCCACWLREVLAAKANRKRVSGAFSGLSTPYVYLSRLPPWPD